jgi:hypothetical protein
VPLVAVLAVICLFFSLLGSASAETLSPWFHVASVSLPGRLDASAARDEVQEITAEPGEFAGKKGSFFQLSVNGKLVGRFATEELTVFGTEATAANLRVALEAEEFYGKGNVEVTPKSGAAPGAVALLVTSIGADADRPVSALEVLAPAPLLAERKLLTPGRPDGEIVVTVTNVGDGTADDKTTPLVITDKLPPHLKALFAEGNSALTGQSRGPVQCAVAESQEVRCTFVGTFEEVLGNGEPNRVIAKTLPPFQTIEVVVGVAVEPGASSGESSVASVSGGGAPAAAATQPITLANTPGEATPFGVENYEQTFEEVAGVPDTQAGSHPFQLTTTLDLNQTAEAQPAALAKDLAFNLPPGLLGDPTAYPRCTLAQFDTIVNGTPACPPSSVLGVVVVTANGLQDSRSRVRSPVFNVEPSPGEPARFAFDALVPVILDTSVRTGGDYGVTVHVTNIPEGVGFLSNTLTLWGVPGDSRHDNSRSAGCLDEAEAPTEAQRVKLKEEVARGEAEPCVRQDVAHPPPFLVLPTSCTGPLQDSIEVDSWAEPHNKVPFASRPLQLPEEGAMLAQVGCGSLAFGSEIKVSPDVQAASTPSGLKVDVHVPQEAALNAEGLAPSDVRNITVALPEGVVLNPSASDGLEACTQAQAALSSPAESSCPDASKIGTATITTPLLPNPLTGFVYLASPQNFASPPNPLENPFGSLLALYLIVKDPVSGVLVKLPGQVSLNGETGQLTTTFLNNPQLPFEDAKLEFFGGNRAPLATPALCRRPGEEGYVTHAAFVPWSNTPAHEEVLQSTSEFNITTGPGGGPCPNAPGVQTPAALPFAPSLASETTNINAGGFTPLSTTMTREDGQQSIQSVTLHYPPGVSGLLSGVKLCPEAQANAGTCGPESEIGETIISVGLGGDPFTVTGGKVYITEHYAGAPFGLSIVNPAKAGPFILQEGRPVVVRAKVEVDPHTAALTITTDASGEHAIPKIIEGIPLQIKHVNVTITRPGFTFNPTSCKKTTITGVVNSNQGASSPVAVPFQVTNCATLKFAPKFSVTTSGKTSRAKGASLSVKLTYPKAPFGSQANIARVKVDLPKQLPSRLTTLQKACTNAQFELNPANCPKESFIGHAKALTPLLPVPLEGPAIFVSHGGEAFPSLIIVLQGYGVTLDLVGTTFISKSGITSSTFKTVPDAPVGSFELVLPEGKYSALAANGNLCKVKGGLKMPTEFLAQNGAKINRSTKISVTGCKKSKQAGKHHKRPAKRSKGRRK